MITNLFNPAAAIVGGGAIRISDGGIDSSVTSYTLSTFIDLSSCNGFGCNIPVYGSDPSIDQTEYGVAFYRADDSFLSALTVQTGYTFIAKPAGAKFVQFGWLTASILLASVEVVAMFNGALVLTLPPKPGLKEVEFIMDEKVALASSPYTGKTQLQAWSGSDWWEVSLTLPQMTQDVAPQWSAFLGECRGRLNVFPLSDPLHRQPVGTPKGTPVVSGANVAMATRLNVRGLTPNTTGHLLEGDQMQLGTYLHRVLRQVDSDVNGNAVIHLWPTVREALADGDPIILNNPTGLFRLTDNRRSLLSKETRLSGVSLKCMEAR